ncbi:MAG: urease subunit beta [Acidobacteriota bacterium]|nr:urease subunit beta [Acidobacteriota bacterium]
MMPGEYLLASEPIEANVGRPTLRLTVANRGDRPVQVGSHCHFFEVNRWLAFDRPRAYGMRLNVPAGTAVRFEPGDTREVELVALGGRRHVHGLNGLVDGPLDDPAVRERALARVRTFAGRTPGDDERPDAGRGPESHHAD